MALPVVARLLVARVRAAVFPRVPAEPVARTAVTAAAVCRRSSAVRRLAAF